MRLYCAAVVAAVLLAGGELTVELERQLVWSDLEDYRVLKRFNQDLFNLLERSEQLLIETAVPDARAGYAFSCLPASCKYYS
ncbi:hypothetical protein [Agaribacterium haliotis]|uniref:hypothetical protein n=1 Tax=Agaribacterium haliotis TaxID=2013869 RepID=UPI0011784147|nr:hypothetical protein [Agaribacterium haliotis]